MKRVKGYVGGRHRLYRTAVEAALRAESYAYRDRRARKRQFRRLWIVRINAACGTRGLRYSELINGMNKADVKIDRKMLAEMAVNDPRAFDEICTLAKAAVN